MAKCGDRIGGACAHCRDPRPVIGRIPIHALQAVVGVLLLFGLRWLSKAVLRSIGVIPLHDEDEAFARETRELTEAERLADGNGSNASERPQTAVDPGCGGE